MARPARFNADYFTHSADLRNDRRVKAIRTAYGAAGYGLFIMLLEALTDADNTALPIDEMELELLAGDFGVSATDIRNLSQFGIKVGYFATNEAGLLTCPELNSWLAPVFDKRNRARNAAPAGFLQQDNTETVVSVTVNPQSKVKKSKVNTTDVVAAAPEGLKATLSNDLTARLASLTDTSGEIVWSESILNKPEYFAKIARKLITAPDVDIEHYRRAMLLAAEANNLSRDVKGWQSWVSIFLTNQLQRGPLLTVAAATVDLSQPTPKNQLPLPGSDCTGRHIVLPNTGDANMNRMYAANYERNYPNAIIHTTR